MELTQDRINEYVEWARANLRCCHECKQIEAYQVVVALADENAKLRKVADAAAAFDRDGSKHRELVDALKESGR